MSFSCINLNEKIAGDDRLVNDYLINKHRLELPVLNLPARLGSLFAQNFGEFTSFTGNEELSQKNFGFCRLCRGW